MRISLLLAIIFTGASVYAQDVSPYNVPETVRTCFECGHLYDQYEISGRINPFYLRGDLDGDGKADYAVLIKEKSSGKDGIAICQSTSPKVHILAAAKKFTWRDNFPFDAWKVYGKRKVWRIANEEPPLKLIGEAIWVENEEAGSGLIYWDGGKYAWYQQGV